MLSIYNHGQFSVKLPKKEQNPYKYRILAPQDNIIFIVIDYYFYCYCFFYSQKELGFAKSYLHLKKKYKQTI